MAHLLVAHPGHELLLHGWISRNRPVVHVLTDGSAHSADTRLRKTAALLRDAGARAGAIFGPLSDAEAYAMILIDESVPALYERYGERVAARQYTTVIRRREHMLPLRAAVEKRSCAF